MAALEGIRTEQEAGSFALNRRGFVGLMAASALGLSGCAPLGGVLGPKPTPMTSGSPPLPPRQTPTPTRSGLVWSDEFDGRESSLPSAANWSVAEELAGLDNHELEGYTARPENLSLDGKGNLRITARAENYSNAAGARVSFTSGHMQTRQAFRYGRIEARVKVPAGAGLWPAFWTMGIGEPAIHWPATGEIDIMEFVNDATTLYADVHADTTSGGEWDRQGRLASETSFADDWHIYSVDWTTDVLVFAADGTEYHRVEKAALLANNIWEFDRPQNIILNLAVGGDFPQTAPDPAAFPALMLVDYVRVFNAEIHTSP